MNVDTMLAGISSAQFSEWMALSIVEKQLRDESMLEDEALRGASEIRGRVRS